MPNGNTMIAEETFSWLSRYKKILNVLPKERFEFMLHRLIIHRNKYTEYCHEVKKYPLLSTLKKNQRKEGILVLSHLYHVLNVYICILVLLFKLNYYCNLNVCLYMYFSILFLTLHCILVNYS